jgi:hypothetical protein
MTRTRRYIIMKETSYFPDTEAYDDVQKKKAAMKYNLVNLLHPLFLLGVGLLLLWPLLDYPDRYGILENCNRTDTSWNPMNQTWYTAEEEKAWMPYKHWARAYDDVSQLEAWYHRRNESMFNETFPDIVVYEGYNKTAIVAAKAIIEPAMNEAYANWSIKYKGLRDCAKEYVATGDRGISNTLAIGFVVLYSVIFLLSLVAREVFLHYMVKKEYTASEWKKESHNNMFWICLWFFVSLLYIAYLYWIPARREAYLNGILSRYWAV